MVLKFLKDAVDFIGEVLTAPERQERQRYERERQYYMDKFKIAHRRCGGIAYPIPGTGNGYRCEKCNEGFNAIRHQVPEKYL